MSHPISLQTECLALRKKAGHNITLQIIAYSKNILQWKKQRARSMFNPTINTLTEKLKK